jgi:hypothetical protein
VLGVIALFQQLWPVKETQAFMLFINIHKNVVYFYRDTMLLK